MSTYMRVTRIDLNERELPETVTVVMSRDVADRLSTEYAGCLLHGRFTDDRVTVEWPMNVPVRVAKLFGRMTPTDDVIYAVYDCLSSLCNRFWEDGVDEAARELGVTVTRTVEDARALAAAAHRGQVDKAGAPYFQHVAEVARLLVGYGDEAVMAGYLHDIVEDTDVTLDQLLAAGFPEVVVAAVDAVTRRDGEEYMDLIGRAAAHPLGRLVKLADNATNSDETRLALLDTKTADRLRRKYARARVVLEAAGGAT